MPSKARLALDAALSDVDAQISQAKSYSGGRRGAPATKDGRSRPGRPFTRGGVVLLAGAIEGFAEALVTEVGTVLLDSTQRKDLKRQVDLSHGANVHHVHQLLATVGMPFALDKVGWRGLPKGRARGLLSEIASARNKIAHGTAPSSARLAELEHWRRLVGRLADELDAAASAHIVANGHPAPW